MGESGAKLQDKKHPDTRRSAHSCSALRQPVRKLFHFEGQRCCPSLAWLTCKHCGSCRNRVPRRTKDRESLRCQDHRPVFGLPNLLESKKCSSHRHSGALRLSRAGTKLEKTRFALSSSMEANGSSSNKISACQLQSAGDVVLRRSRPPRHTAHAPAGERLVQQHLGGTGAEAFPAHATRSATTGISGSMLPESCCRRIPKRGGPLLADTQRSNMSRCSAACLQSFR